MSRLLLFTVMSVALACAPRVTRPEPALATSLDAALDNAVNEKRIVGGVLLVARDGEVVYRRAVGLADREANLAMKEDALFRYASITKPIVATAALELIAQGKLKLEDPVTKYLPTFQPKLDDGTTPVITVQQLLTHTSGLGYVFAEPADGPYHRAGVSDGLDDNGATFEENARRIASAPLLAPPGTAFHYSLSTDILGGVVAVANGTTLQKAVEQLVTKPLGMKDSAFSVTDIARLTTPYVDGPLRMEKLHKVPFAASTVDFAPARILDANARASGGAGMAGTASDVLTLLESLRVRDDALKDQLVGVDTSELGANAGFSFIGAVRRETGIVSWGGVYGHSWFIDPKAKLSVVLLTNTAFEGMDGKLPKDIERAIYAAN